MSETRVTFRPERLDTSQFFFFTFLPKYFNVYVIKRHIFCTGYLIYMVWLHAVSVELR